MYRSDRTWERLGFFLTALGTWGDRWGRHSFILSCDCSTFLPLTSSPLCLPAWMVHSLSRCFHTRWESFSGAGVRRDSLEALWGEKSSISGLNWLFFCLFLLDYYWIKTTTLKCLFISTALHPWLYIPGWRTDLDWFWFWHIAWHKSMDCSAMAATSSRASDTWTWAALTQRSSPAPTHTRASNTASASRLRAPLWVSSWPAVVPPQDTASNKSCPVCVSTAVIRTCVTAPLPGSMAHCTSSVQWPVSCLCGSGCDWQQSATHTEYI